MMSMSSLFKAEKWVVVNVVVCFVGIFFVNNIAIWAPSMHYTYTDVRALFKSILKKWIKLKKMAHMWRSHVVSVRVLLWEGWECAFVCVSSCETCWNVCLCVNGRVAIERAGGLHVVPVRNNTFYCRYKCIFLFLFFFCCQVPGFYFIWLFVFLITFSALHCNTGWNTCTVHISVGYTPWSNQ